MSSQTLYIIQGVPGSGKSTVTKLIQIGLSKQWETPTCLIFSTDDFHMVDGVYKFQPEKLGQFHQWNLDRTILALNQGWSVIVDNTNIRRKDCYGYVKFAVDNQIPVVFIRVTGDFQSIHGVPQHAIDRMRNSMEDLSVESVLDAGPH